MGEETSTSMEATLAVVVSRLDDLRTSFADLRKEMTDQAQKAVPRGEWIGRNNLVDRRFEEQGSDIQGIRKDLEKYMTDQQARRAPWWTIVSVVFGAAGVAGTLVTILTVAY